MTFQMLVTTKGHLPFFLDADAAAIRGNYLQFWGPFWLAGKAVPADGIARREDFLVPGPYTVHDAAVAVDGTLYRPGDVVQLGRGEHSLQAVNHAAARLFWGNRIKPPAYAPPKREWWVNF